MNTPRDPERVAHEAACGTELERAAEHLMEAANAANAAAGLMNMAQDELRGAQELIPAAERLYYVTSPLRVRAELMERYLERLAADAMKAIRQLEAEAEPPIPED